MLSTLEGVAGFSSEVNFFNSGVGESHGVRHKKTVKSASETVQATPPSMP